MDMPQTEVPDLVHSLVPEGSQAELTSKPLSDEIIEIQGETAEHAKGPEAEMGQLREDMRITEHIDPLQALLNAPLGPVEDKWHCARLKTDFQIKSLDNPQYAKVQEEATRYTRNRRTGRMEKDIDASTMSLLVCVQGTKSPAFTDQQLLKKYHAIAPKDVVKAALLPGEIDKLAEAILNLSGYQEDLEDLGKD